jgi:hypothetical protein
LTGFASTRSAAGGGWGGAVWFANWSTAVSPPASAAADAATFCALASSATA